MFELSVLAQKRKLVSSTRKETQSMSCSIAKELCSRLNEIRIPETINDVKCTEGPQTSITLDNDKQKHVTLYSAMYFRDEYDKTSLVKINKLLKKKSWWPKMFYSSENIDCLFQKLCEYNSVYALLFNQNNMGSVLGLGKKWSSLLSQGKHPLAIFPRPFNKNMRLDWTKENTYTNTVEISQIEKIAPGFKSTCDIYVGPVFPKTFLGAHSDMNICRAIQIVAYDEKSTPFVICDLVTALDSVMLFCVDFRKKWMYDERFVGVKDASPSAEGQSASSVQVPQLYWTKFQNMLEGINDFDQPNTPSANMQVLPIEKVTPENLASLCKYVTFKFLQNNMSSLLQFQALKVCMDLFVLGIICETESDWEKQFVALKNQNVQRWETGNKLKMMLDCVYSDMADNGILPVGLDSRSVNKMRLSDIKYAINVMDKILQKKTPSIQNIVVESVTKAHEQAENSGIFHRISIMCNDPTRKSKPLNQTLHVENIRPCVMARSRLGINNRESTLYLKVNTGVFNEEALQLYEKYMANVNLLEGNNVLKLDVTMFKNVDVTGLGGAFWNDPEISDYASNDTCGEQSTKTGPIVVVKKDKKKVKLMGGKSKMLHSQSCWMNDMKQRPSVTSGDAVQLYKDILSSFKEICTTLLLQTEMALTNQGSLPKQNSGMDVPGQKTRYGEVFDKFNRLMQVFWKNNKEIAQKGESSIYGILQCFQIGLDMTFCYSQGHGSQMLKWMRFLMRSSQSKKKYYVWFNFSEEPTVRWRMIPKTQAQSTPIQDDSESGSDVGRASSSASNTTTDSTATVGSQSLDITRITDFEIADDVLSRILKPFNMYVYANKFVLRKVTVQGNEYGFLHGTKDNFILNTSRSMSIVWSVKDKVWFGKVTNTESLSNDDVCVLEIDQGGKFVKSKKYKPVKIVEKLNDDSQNETETSPLLRAASDHELPYNLFTEYIKTNVY